MQATEAQITKPRTEHDMVLLLRDYYKTPEYVLLPQIRNNAGFSATRTIDALAMSVWPSRGLYLTGVEIKVSRSDWLRELRNPRKADEVAEYCDFWMLAVADESIVREGELPPTWGLLTPGKAGKLKQKQPPSKLEAKPTSRGFLAAILKGAMEVTVPLTLVDAEIERRVNERLAKLEENTVKRLTRDLDVVKLRKRNEELEAAAQAFKDASGVWLDATNTEHLKKLGAALGLLSYSSPHDWLGRLIREVDGTSKTLRQLRDAIPAKESEEIHA